MTTSETAFVVKGSLVPLTVLMVTSTDLDVWNQQLAVLSKQAPQLFKQMPVVLDFSQWQRPSAAVDFTALKELLAHYEWILVGVRAIHPALQGALKAADIALIIGSKPTAIASEQPASESLSSAAPSVPMTTKFINKPVRSGQQVYARNADLVVMAPVSHGAELLADGFIHVYGSLRGRALAGINGNEQARIFCQSIDAELVSIAGCYLTNEDAQRLVSEDSVCIYLEKETLYMTKLLQKCEHSV